MPCPVSLTDNRPTTEHRTPAGGRVPSRPTGSSGHFADRTDSGPDDADEWSGVERSATVRDLLMARSGITHPAASQEPLGVPRGRYRPGQKWLYNNWDFNALGTVFSEATGRGVFDAFGQWVATPLGMEDFDPGRCTYQRIPASRHAAYKFMMSPRDLARFGLLYLRGGDWFGCRVVPTGWVAESTRPLSRPKPAHHWFGGYGYLWWTAELAGHAVFAATGALAQGVVVVPHLRLVVVHANRPIVTPDGVTIGWHPPTWTELLPVFTALVTYCEASAGA
jgi:CubicO group peptidase (beta-lactamase class C family)